MAVDKYWMSDTEDSSLNQPALSTDVEADGATDLPWVLLESQVRIADRSNATTACLLTKCGKQIQVTLCVDRPPRVSYLCVFCRAEGDGERDEQMIRYELEVMATEGNLVLLRIALGNMNYDYEADLYVYRSGGREGPSLTLLKRPPGGYMFRASEIGLFRYPNNRADDHDESSSGSRVYLRPHRPIPDKSYIVAALCQCWPRPGRGRFMLYLYNSKNETWTTTVVSVDEHQMQQYQEQCHFVHLNTKVIAIGGDDYTIGFVDLWRGILLCDLRQVQDNPRLRYISLPDEVRAVLHPDEDDARLSRDIAVVKNHIKFVQLGVYPTDLASVVASWSRSGSLEDAWQKDYDIELSKVDVSNHQLELLPKPQGYENGPLPPFNGLCVIQPTLSLHNGDATVCFMVKVNYYDEKAWVIAVDMMMKKLQGVVEFDAKRYVAVEFAYLHSRISKYLKSVRCYEGKPETERDAAAGIPKQETTSSLASPILCTAESWNGRRR